MSCSCPCFKYNNLCKHSIWVAEIVGILKEHLDFLKTSPRRKAPARSDLLEPAKGAQGKKAGRNKNPWRPNRRPSQETAQRTTSRRSFTEVHHNNKPFFLCFIDDGPNAKECRQCRIEFPRRQKITPFYIVLSHEEKWLYPSLDDPRLKLPSATHTTKFYCVKRSSINSRFPYFDSSLLQIPAEAQSRLQKSHFDLLKEELDYEPQVSA